VTDTPGPEKPRRRRRRRRRRTTLDQPVLEFQEQAPAAPAADGETPAAPEGGRRRRRRRRRRGGGAPAEALPAEAVPGDAAAREKRELRGIFEGRKDGVGFLRQPAAQLEPRPDDPAVPLKLVRRFQLKTGSEVEGVGFTNGKAPRLEEILRIDGLDVREARTRRSFKKLRVIDPDFHYELGGHPQEGQISMRILDLLCPIGRGQRGLLVAPPRSGKTTILQQIARAMEALYPDVQLIVLLVDERPEEATYWRRSVQKGEVYCSTLDQGPKSHVRLAEMVQARAERLVEAGREVIILLDSITRLARAYNNVLGSSGKTMSGGLDARTMARPKQFFGAARNTEDAGSLTILATCLVDTGSRMDQVIFEEFKGTGNMELVLDRRLADRRIFPAIAVDKSGTRKEELLRSRAAMRRITILRRVLSRMRPFEAIELLVDRLGRFESNQDFLNAFSMDDVA